PPYWMTYSGCSSGSVDCASDNLDKSYYDAYADYLTNVVDWYGNQGLIFRTIEPFNETSRTQEGCYFSCSTKNTIIKKVGINLKNKGLSNQTSISAADERCIDPHAKLYVSQYNTHAYGGTERTLLNALQNKMEKGFG
ncbi:10325_t:CDS:2, partial [Scutellospora calospora]